MAHGKSPRKHRPLSSLPPPGESFYPTVAELTSSKRRPDRAAPRGGKPLRDFAGLRGREPFGALTLASFAEIAPSPRPRLLPSFLSFPIIRPPLLLSQAKLFTASRAPHTALAHLHLHDPDSSSGSQPTHHFLRCCPVRHLLLLDVTYVGQPARFPGIIYHKRGDTIILRLSLSDCLFHCLINSSRVGTVCRGSVSRAGAVPGRRAELGSNLQAASLETRSGGDRADSKASKCAPP